MGGEHMYRDRRVGGALLHMSICESCVTQVTRVCGHSTCMLGDGGGREHVTATALETLSRMQCMHLGSMRVWGHGDLKDVWVHFLLAVQMPGFNPGLGWVGARGPYAWVLWEGS